MRLECICSTDFLPHSLRAVATQSISQLWESLTPHHQIALNGALKQTDGLDKQLVKALIGSEYIKESCCRDPQLLFSWLLSDVPFAPITPVKIIDAINMTCADDMSLDDFNRLIRKLRRRFMTGIFWRDLNQLADFNETAQAVTALAEVCIQQALDVNFKDCVKKYGMPIGKDSGLAQQMLVVGMGKLGGGELNVSSDIDLMFVFDEGGQTDHPKKPIDNQLFFNRLGQQLIKSLAQVTAEGFVFRVDMRLRPYGQSGALCSSFLALENYYQSQGRDWERFAAIKARIVACAQLPDAIMSIDQEIKSRENFYQLLKPFVYRQYIDFSMIESLRQLKAMILQEVNRKNMQDDIKLGAGGIRELEFIAQTFQLIRGGRDNRLQTRHFLSTLSQLAKLQILNQEVSEQLAQAYIFLRTVEHFLQAYKDEQTQTLPTDEQGLFRLAYLLGFDSTALFLEKLNGVRDVVTDEFEQVINSPMSEPADDEIDEPWRLLWEQVGSSAIEFDDSTHRFVNADGLAKQLDDFKKNRHVAILSANAREKLDRFMPVLLKGLSDSRAPDRALARVLPWVDSIVNRPQYLALFLENPQVLKFLIDLFLSSRWVVETLTTIPVLLDELLYPERLLSLPDKSQLQSELRQRFLRLDPNDEELAMETLRHFKVAHNLHAAAMELSGRLSLMQVSDYLSFTAEVVLEQVLLLAWQALTERHGYPPDLEDPSLPHFLIVGYGKLGGLEMSYGSDLDLVFIYDADAQGMTNGERPLDTPTFYMRLGQKIIHQLNVRTVSGPLYEVDMRLRPSGNSGLLVSSIKAFARYQHEDAWAWEHQALVRARPIAGDAALAKAFIAVRKAVLAKPRDQGQLKAEVADMRQKMREHLGSGHQKGSKKKVNDQFHLKQDQGGVVDIEFMVQYAVLAWADLLIEHYQTYRKLSHRLSLEQAQSSLVDAADVAIQRRDVRMHFFKK